MGNGSTQEKWTRFRIFYPAEHESVPRVIVDMMSALGACGSGTAALLTAAPPTIASGAKSTSCGRTAPQSGTSFRSGSTVLTPSHRMGIAQETFATG